jgi:hypothetical protein
MIKPTMAPPTFASLFILILTGTVSAFEIHMYNAKNCAGGPMSNMLNVADGCSTYGAGIAQAIIMPWLSEMDNDQLLVTYSDDNCCHASKIESYGWTDECIPFTGEAVRSWRVLDPIVDPDMGKADQIENYKCQKCGTDACGTIQGGLIPFLPGE